MPGFNIRLPGSCSSPGAPQSQYTGRLADNTVETARAHRYVVEILTPLRDILVYAHKCTRPTPEIDKIVIHHQQDEISRPGKNRWKQVEFTFYETLSNTNSSSGAAALIYEWWGHQVIDLPNSLHGRAPRYYLNIAEITMLDGAGAPAWRYQLLDTWPSNVTPSELSYSDSAIATITVTLQCQKAKEIPV